VRIDRRVTLALSRLGFGAGRLLAEACFEVAGFLSVPDRQRFRGPLQHVGRQSQLLERHTRFSLSRCEGFSTPPMLGLALLNVLI